MRKRNTLYTVNKHNMPLFMPDENLFYGGGDVWQQLAYKKDPLGFASLASQGIDPGQVYSKTKNFLGITKTANPFSKGNLKLAGNNIASGLAGGAGTLVGNAVGGAVAGDYELGGVDTVASTLQSINTGNPIIDVAKNAIVGTLSGVVKRGFGIATDENKLRDVNSSIAQNNSFVSNASSNDAIRGRQAVSTDTNVYSDGWFTSSADDKNKELAQRLADSISWADRSIENNISNVAQNNINNQLANYAAEGGELNMGPVELDLAYAALAAKKRKAESQDRMTNMFMGTPSGLFADGGGIHIDPAKKGTFKAQATKMGMSVKEAAKHIAAHPENYSPAMRRKAGFVNGIVKAEGGPINILYDDTPLFAFGGDMETNGADFGTGLTHVSAGSSHELNPNDGVQMGVDPNGVPNLVEENETVYNDYVYSARIKVPQEVQKWLGVKGKDISFADASKQLEKEIKERPNDPVSIAGFKAMMSNLADEQEFIKNCSSYAVGEVYDVDDAELALLAKNGYAYEKLG